MSCPYFEEGYFGICCASGSHHMPSLDTMEKYCFKNHYKLCPSLTSK